MKPQLLAAAAALWCAGCVERKMVIRSDPEGAVTFVDGREVGLTPVEVPFRFYGKRRIELELKGHETLQAVEDISAPWWQYPVLDLMTDVLIPATFTDRRELRYELKPAAPTENPASLEERADPLRDRLRGP
jgi:hypothetical protein